MNTFEFGLDSFKNISLYITYIRVYTYKYIAIF